MSERIIYDQNSKELISEFVQVVGVEGDADTRSLLFRVPKKPEETDISTWNFKVNYRNANGQAGTQVVTPTVDGDWINLTFLIPNSLTVKSGNVKVGLCAASTDGKKHWHTGTIDLKVINFINGEDIDLSDPKYDIIGQVWQAIQDEATEIYVNTEVKEELDTFKASYATDKTTLNTKVDGKIDTLSLTTDGKLEAKANGTVKATLGPFAAIPFINGGYVADGKLHLTYNDDDFEGFDPITLPASGSGGLSFDSGYVSDDNKLHLTSNGSDIEGFDPFVLPAGGSGGGASGSKLIFAMKSPATMSVLQTSGTCKVKFKFTSTDTESDTATGAGSLGISVGGIAKDTLTIEQGDNKEVDVFPYLTIGTNTIKLTMTDSYGATATRTVKVTLDTFSLSWNLGKTHRNDSANLSFNVTPTGVGSKKITVYVDGESKKEETVTVSGRRVDFSITLTPGYHLVEVQGSMTSNGATLLTEKLSCAVAQMSNQTAPVVVANLTTTTVDQFTTLAIPFRVIDLANNPASVDLYVGTTKIETRSVDQSEQVWSYRFAETGSKTLKIKSGTTEWTKTVTVTGISSDITEVSGNLALKVDPNTLTSLSSYTLSDHFDTVNGGLTLDDDGIKVIKVCKGDTLTIPYKPFGSDAKETGAEIKIIYKVENSTLFDGDAITCKQGSTGLTIKANSAELSTAQSSLKLETCEDVKTELDINIEPDSSDRLMMMWESGTPAKVGVYARTDSFRQSDPVGIKIGSPTCDVTIYKIRVYTRDLTKSEIQANFEFDGKDAAEIVARHNRNQIFDGTGKVDPDKVAEKCPNLHIITWHGPAISTAKSQKVTGKLTHKFPAGGASHSWTAENVTQKAQGTSSLGYVQAGCNEDFEFSSITLEDGTTKTGYSMTDDSIAVGYLNFKTNVASQEHINNILLNDWINKNQPYKRPARTANSKVRDTVEGHLCVFFFHNTGSTACEVGPYTVQPDETIFYSLGCLNNSKKNKDVFAYDKAVVEVMNNTDDLCRFKSNDLSSENFDESGSYGLRYIDETQTSVSAVKTAWKTFLDFVVACDADKAPNTALTPAVTIDSITYPTDNEAYRTAKFKKELGNHVVLNSVLFHYLYTLVFSQVDNRAKNTFWGWGSDGKWHLNFAYDNDTAMGNDNEGGLTLRYGYMDTDTVGTRDVFNASDSALFKMIGKAFETELHNLYLTVENAGGWDLDAFANTCDAEQSKACEALWAEDAWRKDIDPFTVLGTSAYLPMLNGKKRLQRRQFLHFQRAFMASRFDGSYSISNSATIRAYTPAVWTGVEPKSEMTITPYSHLWVTVKAGSKDIKKRATAGTPVNIPFETASLNDTETYVRSAPFIQDLGDISCLYPGYLDVSNCKKLKELKAGSSVTGYQNTNLTEVGVSAAKNLEIMNVEGCPELKSELDLDSNKALRELYTRNSGVTGVAFAEYGKLQKAKLNGVSSIFANKLQMVSEFDVSTGENLTSLNIEGSSGIDVLKVAKGCKNIQSVRLKNMSWSAKLSDYETIKALGNATGIDDDGHSVSTAVITGTCVFDAIGPTKLAELTTLIPGMTFSTVQSLTERTVTFKNNGVTLLTERIEDGGTLTDPVARGLIGTPTKDNDVDWTYHYMGWSKDLSNVTADLICEAVFGKTVRKYTITFADWDGTVLQKKENISAHGSVKYTGDDPYRAGYIWTGWNSTGNDDVTADEIITASYTYPGMPSSKKNLANYDYAYSDDPNDDSAYTFGELYQIIKTGQASEYLPAGSEVKMLIPENSVISDSSIVFVVHSYGHYQLTGSTQMTKCDFYAKGILNVKQKMHSGNTNIGGWNASELRNWLNNDVYNVLRPWWKQLMVKSVTLASKGNVSIDIQGSDDYLRVPSRAELGLESTAVPYKNEVSSNAQETAFSVYTDANSRQKKYFNGEGVADVYWQRSPNPSSNDQYSALLGNGGSLIFSNSGSSYGICPGFSA